MRWIFIFGHWAKAVMRPRCICPLDSPPHHAIHKTCLTHGHKECNWRKKCWNVVSDAWFWNVVSDAWFQNHTSDVIFCDLPPADITDLMPHRKLRLADDFEMLHLKCDLKTLRQTPARFQTDVTFRNNASETRFQNHFSNVSFCASDVQYESGYVISYAIRNVKYDLLPCGYKIHTLSECYLALTNFIGVIIQTLCNPETCWL